MARTFSPVRDVSAASWIASRLGPFGGDVGSNVPRGFEAYARILHPVEGHATLATWADVCATTGRQPHAAMQWESISGSWDGGEPDQGNLAPGALEALCLVLARHTPVDIDCVFGVWEGYGWGDGRLVMMNSAFGEPTNATPTLPARQPALPPEVINGPRLVLPNRSYFLFTGPLLSALALGDRPTRSWFLPQSPNLFWPPDRSWCVASEIDFDSTLVGGSSRLVAGILADPALEAWPITPDDSLAYDGDHINGRWEA